jgi:ubiquinone biosynthesis protein COQ9
MASIPDTADLTLDEICELIAPRLATNAAFDGWNDQAIESAAFEVGIDADIAKLALKGGPMTLIDAWIGSVDVEMAKRLPPETLNTMKIRDRITTLIATRLEITAPDKEGQRRALAIMAMPQNIPSATRIGWRTADRMWRLAGDTATDLNHYTKRMTLSAVYASTLAVFVNDESEDFADTRAFLDRRIGNVMQIEKIKAQAKSRREYVPSLSRFIGRLRYPPR